MLRLDYKPDVYIETVYRRIMDRLPAGTFYVGGGISLPYTLDPTRFVLETDYPGLRHVIRSTTVPVLELPLIPQLRTSEVPVPLQSGDQVLTVTVYSSDGTVKDSYSLPLTVINFGTLAYAGAQSIVKEWVTAIDLYYQVLSGYQLLIFETSLPHRLRELLPADYNTKLLALKNLMRVSVLGSSNEGINSFISAVCQMNPPKISKYFNREVIDDSRLEDATFELASSDVKLWFGSYAMGRRAVLAKMVNNFPGRYSDILAGNSMLVLGLTEYAKFETNDPTESAIYVDLTERDDSDLTIALNMPAGQGLEFSMESETTMFIPNYHFTDYHEFHGIHPGYVPANIKRYGSHAWFKDPLGNLDRIAEVYAIPDLPESRLDGHGLEGRPQMVTFHASNSAIRSNYDLEEANREDYEAISESRVGERLDNGDRLRLDMNDGRSQPWLTSDWDYAVIDSDFVIDYHQGLKVSAMAWTEMTITLSPPSAPYITEEINTSVLILPGRSRPTAPGSRTTLDELFHYSEDESLTDEVLGVDLHASSELWMRMQRSVTLPSEFYNGQSFAVPFSSKYQTLTTGFTLSESNPFRMLEGTLEVGTSSFWSSNQTAEEFFESLGFKDTSRQLLLVCHRDNRTGRQAMILVANGEASGTPRESSRLKLTLRGLPLGIDVIELDGALVSIFSDRYEIELAWYGSGSASCLLLGFQGFDSLLETKKIQIQIENDALPSPARCDSIRVLGPESSIRTGILSPVNLALELLY